MDSTVTQNEDFETLVAPEVEVPKTVTAKAAFIAKCLHPPASVAGFSGLPTNDTRTQVTVEYKGLNLMQAPGYLTPERTCKAPSKRPTSLAMLIPGGGARIPYIAWFKDTDNGNWYQDLCNTVINDTYDFAERMAFDVNLYRPCYKSVTTTLNTTMFNNTGMVTGSSFNPPLLFGGDLMEFAERMPDKFRSYVKWMANKGEFVPLAKAKFHHDWPKYIRDTMAEMTTQIVQQLDHHTNNSEEEYELISKTRKLGLTDRITHTVDLDPSSQIQFAFFGACTSSAAPVPSASQLLNNDSRATSYPAREGAFTIQHLNTISPAWKTVSNGRVKAETDRSRLYICALSWQTPDESDHFVILSDPANLGATRIYDMTDAQWTNDMTWSWVIFEGLSYNSNQDAVTQQQLIASKWISGFEYQPAMLSAFAGLSHLAPKPDLKAMEELLRDLYEIKSILPARYNFLGMLARGAMKVLPTLVKHAPKVLNILGKVSSFADDEEGRSAINKEEKRSFQKSQGGKIYKQTGKSMMQHRAENDMKTAQKDLQIARQTKGQAKKVAERKAAKKLNQAVRDNKAAMKAPGPRTNRRPPVPRPAPKRRNSQ